MVGILGLIVAIVCVIALIWKNWHMAIVSLAGALIVIAFNAMDPVTTLSEKFMTGMSGFAGNWFLLFMLGGAQWNGNFKPFKDSKFDDKIMYTCHRYGGEPTQAAIQTIINFRDSVNLPMYMGEIGHNTDEWQAAFCQTMRENNIGYTFWPYKKMDGSSFVGITPPENWANIVYFSEAPRATYKEIREARPAQAMSRKAMMDFIEACKLKNCVVQEGYIRSLGMK